MNGLNQITFLSELNRLLRELQELLNEYCEELTAEQEEYGWEEKTNRRNQPF